MGSQNIVLFGDPAFHLHLPRMPIAAPARVVVAGDVATAYAPDQWTINSETDALAHEWKWPGQLHYYGAPGVVSHYRWAGKYDTSKPYLFARFQTDKSVSNIVKLDEAPLGLGWSGKFLVDEHGDGTRTVIWRIRLLDYQTETGIINDQLSSQSFRV